MAVYVRYFQMSRCLVLDYGREKVRFVAHNNYRRKGARFDNVEVKVGGEIHAAKVLFFASTAPSVSVPMEAPTEDQVIYAVVQYYNIVKAVDPMMNRPVVQLSSNQIPRSYHFINVLSIVKHAHLVPDSDAPADDRHFFWDKYS